MNTGSTDELLRRARARRGLPAPDGRRILRELNDLTQAEVARLLGVSRPTVSRWEAGKRTPRRRARERYVALLERLAREVGVAASEANRD